MKCLRIKRKLSSTKIYKGISAVLLKNKENIYDDISYLEYLKSKKICFENNLNSIEVLALKCSITDFSFFSPCWKNSYNLGLISINLYESYELYIKYKIKLEALKYVIIFFPIFTPGFSLIKTKEKYRLVAIKYFFEIPYQNNNLIDRKKEREIFRKCTRISNKLSSNNIEYGYINRKNYIDLIDVKERVSGHLRENKREPDQLEWLIKLNNEIKQNNQKLYVVIPPYRSDYMKCLSDKEKLFSKLYDLKLDNCRILNFFKDSNFDDDDFLDTDHLNLKGAKKITSLIKEKVLKDLINE